MSRINICTACRMLEQGVKFRIAPKHTCGKEPKKFKVPRLGDMELVECKIYRTGVVETKKATKVILKAQTINGIDIPDKTELWIAGGTSFTHEFSKEPRAIISGWTLNKLLRTLVIDKLKNG